LPEVISPTNNLKLRSLNKYGELKSRVDILNAVSKYEEKLMQKNFPAVDFSNIPDTKNSGDIH